MSFSIWHLSSRRHVATAFTGEGGRLVSGRWNSKGTAIVYTSATLSLAALEKFIQMEVEDAGKTMVSIQADIPEDVLVDEVAFSQLPEDWQAIPAPQLTKVIGDNWVLSGSTALLKVPSAVIPSEYNYLINPLHKDFQKIQIHDPLPFVLDSRMWK